MNEVTNEMVPGEDIPEQLRRTKQSSPQVAEGETPEA
jgi:hypothetical protein